MACKIIIFFPLYYLVHADVSLDFTADVSFTTLG